MPKVSEEYAEEKRGRILDAAFAVCSRKPAYDVTMSDIVLETGMSQGGVYKYFGNIDAVLAALIDKANEQGNYLGQIDAAMESGNPPEAILKELFLISERYFSDMLIRYNKILFELGTFFAYNPTRRESVYKNVTTASAFEHLTTCAAKLIADQAERGYFVPVVPVRQVLAFVVASFDGIIRDVTLTKCYSPAQNGGVPFDEKTLIQCLYQSTMALLGKPQGKAAR